MSDINKLVGEKKTIRYGWILVKDNLIWGNLQPIGSSGQVMQGWTDDIDNLLLAEREAKPPCKWWFTHRGDPSVKHMLEGEWVKVKIRKATTIATPIY